MNNERLFRLLNRSGWLLIIISSILGFLIISNIVSKEIISIEMIFIPIGIGFLLLIPWSYFEADEMRKKFGQTNYRYLSYVGKNLFFGLISLFVYFLMHYR
jgi:nicotinamide riboside transporter PnuC